QATAAVGANVQVAGPITVLDYGLLNLDDGSRLNGGLTVNGPNGTVVVSGSPTIAAGSGPNTNSGVVQGRGTGGPTTVPGQTTFNGSSQYLVRLYQSGSGPTNLVTNSIHFANPGMTDFGFSGSYVNITADLTNVPTPDGGDPFWTTDHTWVIADAASGWNNMW